MNSNQIYIKRTILKRLATVVICIVLFLAQGYVSRVSVKLATATATEQVFISRVRTKKGFSYKSYRTVLNAKLVRLACYFIDFERFIYIFQNELKCWYHHHSQLDEVVAEKFSVYSISPVLVIKSRRTSAYHRIG